MLYLCIQGSWTKKLIDRVYNTRKRQASENANDETPPAKRGRPKLQCVLARYPPIEHADDSNDEVANSRNLDALRKEMERDKPRKEFVLSLMRQTFTTRREDILADTNASVSIILEKQSALSLPFAVSDKV